MMPLRIFRCSRLRFSPHRLFRRVQPARSIGTIWQQKADSSVGLWWGPWTRTGAGGEPHAQHRAEEDCDGGVRQTRPWPCRHHRRAGAPDGEPACAAGRPSAGRRARRQGTGSRPTRGAPPSSVVCRMTLLLWCVKRHLVAPADHCLSVVPHAAERDGVERPVRLTAAPAVEPVPDGPAARRLDGRRPAQRRECRLRLHAFGIVSRGDAESGCGGRLVSGPVRRELPGESRPAHGIQHAGRMLALVCRRLRRPSRDPGMETSVSHGRPVGGPDKALAGALESGGPAPGGTHAPMRSWRASGMPAAGRGRSFAAQSAGRRLVCGSAPCREPMFPGRMPYGRPCGKAPAESTAVSLSALV